MPRGKKELAEQIIPKLREVEVEVGRGKTVLEAVKKIGVTEQTYYRWKKKFGGLRVDQAKRLKDLEKENARLKRLLADAGVRPPQPVLTCRIASRVGIVHPESTEACDGSAGRSTEVGGVASAAGAV
jgi:putative transposase